MVFGDKSNKQEKIDLELAWSTDKVHWDSDFSKLILLKKADDKIYIKTKVGEGSCLQDTSNPMNLFGFNIMSIPGKALGFMKKVGDIEKVGPNYILGMMPTSEAPKGQVFKQKVRTNYCGNAGNTEKELNVKVVDIKQTEI